MALDPDLRLIPEGNPTFQATMRCLVRFADQIAQTHDMRCRATCVYRTPEDQEAAYKRGASMVRGGYSWHQYRVAIDIGLFDGMNYGTYISGSHVRTGEMNRVLHEIGQKITDNPFFHDVYWGGRFPIDFPGSSFVDAYHYEIHPGYSVVGGARQVFGWLSNPNDIPYTILSMIEDDGQGNPVAVSGTTGNPVDSLPNVQHTSAEMLADWAKMRGIYAEQHDLRIAENDMITKIKDLQQELQDNYDQQSRLRAQESTLINRYGTAI